MSEVLIVAILFLISGIALVYWINRRKFYRRNDAGIETFSSYGNSVFIRFLERIAKWTGYLLVIFGLLFLLIHFTPPKKKAKIDTQYENKR